MARELTVLRSRSFFEEWLKKVIKNSSLAQALKNKKKKFKPQI